MSKRTRCEIRALREKAIQRKYRKIVHDMGWGPMVKEYSQPGRLSKRYLGCSCGLCRAKTRELGWRHSDIRRMPMNLEDTPLMNIASALKNTPSTPEEVPLDSGKIPRSQDDR